MTGFAHNMAAIHKEVGKRYCKYHPQRPCTKCVLCGKSSTYYSHYDAWSEDEKAFLRKYWDAELDPSSCICAAHQKEAKRPHPTGYTPKWSKIVTQKEETMKTCMHPSCSSTEKLITPSFASFHELRDKLKVQCSEDQQLLLCSRHYQELYRKFSSHPCASCGIKPKLGCSFTRHSPDPNVINDVFGRNRAEVLTSADYICLSCYKSHLQIIKSYKQVNHLRDMIKI